MTLCWHRSIYIATSYFFSYGWHIDYVVTVFACIEYLGSYHKSHDGLQLRPRRGGARHSDAARSGHTAGRRRSPARSPRRTPRRRRTLPRALLRHCCLRTFSLYVAALAQSVLQHVLVSGPLTCNDEMGLDIGQLDIRAGRR